MTSGELEWGRAGRQTEASRGFPEEAAWREQAMLGSGRTFWQRKEQVQRLQRQPEPGSHLHGWRAHGRGPGRRALSGWATPFVHETLASSLPELPYPMTTRPSSLSQDATSSPCGPPGPAWKAQHQGPLKSLLPAAGQNPARPVPGVLPRDLPQPWPWSSQSYKPPSLGTPGWQEPSTGCTPPVPTVPWATPG